MEFYLGFLKKTSILTCKLQGWRFRFTVNCRGSCAKTGLGAELLSGKVLTPRAVLSKMNDFLAAARAQQARPRQHRPDKASQKQARQSRPDMHKPPRLCGKAAQMRQGACQIKQAGSKPKQARRKQETGENRHILILFLTIVCFGVTTERKTRSKPKQARRKQETGRNRHILMCF